MVLEIRPPVSSIKRGDKSTWLNLKRLIGVACCLVACLNPMPASDAAEISITPTQLPMSLGLYLDYLEDPDREVTIDQLLTDSAMYSWERNTNSIPTLGISNSAHWFRLFITASQFNEPDQLVLSIDAPVVDYIASYLVRDRQIIRQQIMGDTIPLSQQDFQLRIPALLLNSAELEPGLELYFQVTSSSSIEFPLQIAALSQLLESQQIELAYYGAFFSLLFLCIGVCLLIYINLKDALFSAFTLFFASAIVFFFGISGIGKLWLWPETSEWNTRIVFATSAALILSFALIGTQINIKSRHPDSINLLLRIVAISMIPAVFYYLLIPFDLINRQTVLPIMVLGVLIPLVVVAITGMAAFKGSRTAMYMFVSWILILISYGHTLAYKFEIIERATAMSMFAQLCFVVAIFFLLLSLSEFIKDKNAIYVSARSDARAKTDFLRNVSREILTPVHLILSNSKRLLGYSEEHLDSKTKAQTSTIIKQSNYLHNLINDLLEMAELESDSFEPQMELLELSRFLTEIKNLLARQVEEKGLKIECNFSSANLLVHTDKARLQHAIGNLVLNAIKYTDTGTITIAYKAIYFNRHLGVEISVKDTGRGMSEDFKEMLFQDFAREHPAPELEPEGTGLSLVIVRRMIEKLGGEVIVNSRLGKGSEFIIRLPLRKAESN